ncbi:MAG: hypothetical protein H0X46_04765 [Bacteroidetes bacterium]|nr:hypothetical protein [Bacteroidota bacterium]
MIKNVKYFRSLLLEFLTHKIALPVIGKLRKKPPFIHSMNDLLQFEEGTLGKDLALYLKKMNFKLLPNYEQHDCKHIILQYEMDEAGEARMQFYFLGNKHYSIPVLSTCIICFFLMPEYWKQFIQDYKRGTTCKPFDKIDYNALVYMNTLDLRKQFNN